MRQKRKNTSSNLEKQKKCTDKYEYIYLPKDPFKKPSVEIRGQDKTGACVQHRPLHDFREIY